MELASDPPNEPLSALLDTALEAEEDINIAYYHMARGGLQDWVQPYANMEARARLIRKYMPQLIPGILQTRSYARTLMLAGQPDIPQEELERQVEGGYSRRELLEGPEPLALWSILDESVLACRFGDDPATTAPSTAPSLCCPSRTALIRPIWLGADTAGHLVESTHTVTWYAMIYSHLQVRSLAPEASLDLIRTTMVERYPCPLPSAHSLIDATWRASSYSNAQGGDCVEIADTIPVIRDSKNPTGPALLLPTRAWTGFVSPLQVPRPRLKMAWPEPWAAHSSRGCISTMRSPSRLLKSLLSS
jgi:hypothetical protein